MRFYTSVYEKFNKIYVRGYEDGKYFESIEDFYPTFYVSSKKNSFSFKVKKYIFLKFFFKIK